VDVVPAERPAKVKGSWLRPPSSHRMPDWMREERMMAVAAQRLQQAARGTAGHSDKVSCGT
jgi:hypothetical protein